MTFVVPARSSVGESHDYHLRMDAILNHLREDGSYEELISAGIPERDIDTANEIMDSRGE